MVKFALVHSKKKCPYPICHVNSKICASIDLPCGYILDFKQTYLLTGVLNWEVNGFIVN